MPVALQCVQCGRAFTAPPSHVGARRSLYCGQACAGLAKRRPLSERFWRNVNKEGPVPAQRPEMGPCWIWQGFRGHGGYGRLALADADGRYRSRYAYTHRLSWELAYGPIAEGMEVCHHCDTPACVNPAHLFLGTQRTNTDDRDAKDRVRHGSAHANAKLTEEQVQSLRTLHATGAISYYALARAFNVSYATARDAITGKTWRRV